MTYDLAGPAALTLSEIAPGIASGEMVAGTPTGVTDDVERVTGGRPLSLREVLESARR